MNMNMNTLLTTRADIARIVGAVKKDCPRPAEIRVLPTHPNMGEAMRFLGFTEDTIQAPMPMGLAKRALARQGWTE
jgi:hypothetical protein